MTFLSHRPLLSLFYLLGEREPNSLSQTAFMPNFLPKYLITFFSHFYSCSILYNYSSKGAKLYCQNGWDHDRISPPPGSATVHPCWKSLKIHKNPHNSKASRHFQWLYAPEDGDWNTKYIGVFSVY